MNRLEDNLFSLKHLLVPIVGLSVLSSIGAFQVDKEILYDISATLLDKKGHTFEVFWFYRLDEESWEGKGTLKILGRNYLSLDLPFMNVLIQNSVLSVRYPEEDQVLIDYFNRRDPSNLFAVLLSDFGGFIVENIEVNNEQISLSLIPETLVGFDRLWISVKENEWMPKTIKAVSGKDLEIYVDVLSVGPLVNPEDLTMGKLTASEIIDLRD
jgi:hypothetical protein